MRTHPWTVEVVPGRPVLGPGITAKYESELAALDGIGLSDTEMDQILCSVLALVEASARAQIGLDRVLVGSSLWPSAWAPLPGRSTAPATRTPPCASDWNSSPTASSGG